MVISVKDETGNGLDSARKKFADLQKTMGGGGGGGLVESTIKVGAAIGAMRGSLTLASSLMSAFQGDTEAANQALGRLPFGIGEIVREFGSLLNSFDAGKRAAERFAAAISELRAATRGEELKIGKGMQADIDRLQFEGQQEVDRLAQEAAKALTSGGGTFDQNREQALEINRRIEVVKQRLKAEEQAIRESYSERDRIRVEAFERESSAARKAIAEQAEKERRERIEAEMETQRRLSNVSEFAASSRFREAADLTNILAGTQLDIPDIDRNAINRALEQARKASGQTQLAEGAQNRFGSGLASSARESAARMANETAENTKKTVEKLENIRKLLEDANKPPAVPGINIETLEGLT